MTNYKQDIIDAAIEWQTYWSDNPGDRPGIDQRQGYLYDRVRRYRQNLEKQGGQAGE